MKQGGSSQKMHEPVQNRLFGGGSKGQTALFRTAVIFICKTNCFLIEIQHI